MESLKPEMSTQKYRIGITGQSGFMGTHLTNWFHLKKEFEFVEFEDNYFESDKKLEIFVSQCDTVFHLAALNRHGDPEVIYATNVELVRKLIAACERSNSKPHILFASSTQEEKDNPYGKSKLEGRRLFEAWASRNQSQFTSLIIPNVYGPFGNPYYNSVVATFCHQLTHGEEPQIQVDGKLNLIYINELTEIFYQATLRRLPSQQTAISVYQVPYTSEKRVSEILNLLSVFKTNYYERRVIPSLEDTFERNLFNTFLCYIDQKNHFPVHLKLNTDERGTFVEIIKLNSGGQVSFSTTKPGITRGNHFHTRKAERFAVIKGKASIQLRRIGSHEILNFELNGEKPSYVDMPVWYTHNITNTGSEDLYTIFWINEHFDANDPDTYFEQISPS